MANFDNILLADINGNEQPLTSFGIDIKKQLGNLLYYQSTDLAGSELGRKIYHAEGDISLTPEEQKLALAMLPRLSLGYIAVEAIRKAIEA